MLQQIKDKYDVVIIGAGISGIVCGCYLARAGLKVLIVEKNKKPGGYCSSFSKNGFFFDACVNALGGLRQRGGVMAGIIDELGIEQQLRFNRFNPADIIITPDYKLSIYQELGKTIEEFQNTFPKQKRQIESFFKYVANNSLTSFLLWRSKTFEEMLNLYFNNEQLKTILAVMVTSYLGLPSSNEISALVACLMFKEFLFDGGYYPMGGMQQIPDILLNRYESFGGETALSIKVRRIIIKSGEASGVILDNGKSVFSQYVVSACDAKQTFFELIKPTILVEETKEKMGKMKTSFSAFLVYLGIDKAAKEIKGLGPSNICVINNYDIKEIYNHLLNSECDFFAMTSPSLRAGLEEKNKTSIFLTALAVYKDENYWNEKIKNKMANKLIKMAERVIPGLSRDISLQLTASPVSLYKWTKNYQGAICGWASTPQQFGNPEMSQKTKIENLYITGHWSNQGSGIPAVINCGRDTANLILRKKIKFKIDEHNLR